MARPYISAGRYKGEGELGNKSVLDFRHMAVNPSITGAFVGTENVTDIQQSGAVILNKNQLVSIGGSVKGTTRLNSNGVEYIPSFKENHTYISANDLSDGEFEIQKNTEQIVEPELFQEFDYSSERRWSFHRFRRGYRC